MFCCEIGFWFNITWTIPCIILWNRFSFSHNNNLDKKRKIPGYQSVTVWKFNTNMQKYDNCFYFVLFFCHRTIETNWDERETRRGYSLTHFAWLFPAVSCRVLEPFGYGLFGSLYRKWTKHKHATTENEATHTHTHAHTRLLSDKQTNKWNVIKANYFYYL